MTSDKKTMEEEMYKHFLPILNAKKDKIRELEQALDEQQQTKEPKLKSNLKIAIVYPPKIPIVFPIKTKKGRHRTDAIILGAIRYCIGLVPSVLKASICSVTLIVPMLDVI